MPTHTSLASLFTDIANAIRAKTGGSSQIVADNFPSAIASIPSGGGGSTLGTKTITTNGTYYAASDGYDGFSSVVVNVSGGGGGNTWSVANISAPADLDDNFIAFDAYGISGGVGALILYSKASRTPQANRIISLAYGTGSTKISYFDSSGSNFIQSNGVSVSVTGGAIIIDVTNTNLLIADNNYGLIVVYGGSGTLSLRNANATPGSSQTQVTFNSLAGEPVVYMCALYAATSYASAHRVMNVAYKDSNLLCATNFYTSNQNYYASGFTSSYSGTSLTIASNGAGNGGYFHNERYDLYYLIASDLA